MGFLDARVDCFVCKKSGLFGCKSGLFCMQEEWVIWDARRFGYLGCNKCRSFWIQEEWVIWDARRVDHFGCKKSGEEWGYFWMQEE